MSEDNVEAKSNFDGVGLFDKIEKYVSINPIAKNYQVIDLQSEEVEYLKSIIESLEMNETVILCARGDSLQQKQFDSFMEEKLYDFFKVGSKGNFFRSHLDNDSLLNTHNGNLIEQIKELVILVKDELSKKDLDNEDIDRMFSEDFILQLQESEDMQQTWKLLFLAFLHNKGNDNYFKPFSGLLSVTHGENKYNKAHEFAIGRRKNGFIFVYILNKNSKKYVTAEEIQQMFAEHGVKWYDDIHKEIMIQNGLFPHNIIGFFEIQNKMANRFLVNPWFHLQIKHDLNCGFQYDYKNGVLVDQTDFYTSLRNLGYDHFFIHDHVSDKDFIVDRSEKKIKPNLEKT